MSKKADNSKQLNFFASHDDFAPYAAPTPPEPKTSETDPILVHYVETGTAGRLGLTFAPGKYDPNSRSGIWDRDVDADLERLRNHWNIDVVVTLIEDGTFECDEFSLLDIPDLLERVGEHGMESLWFPFRDCDVPQRRPDVDLLVCEIITKLKRGENIVVHCRGGLGRTGLIVACVLATLGATARTAIREVRKDRKRAVETKGQVRFVHNYARRLAGDWTEV